jgi:hypothetical protein
VTVLLRFSTECGDESDAEVHADLKVIERRLKRARPFRGGPE